MSHVQRAPANHKNSLIIFVGAALRGRLIEDPTEGLRYVSKERYCFLINLIPFFISSLQFSAISPELGLEDSKRPGHG